MEPNNLVRVPLPFFDRVQHQWFLPGFCGYALRNPHWGVLLAIVLCCVTVVPARAQQQRPPEDPENEKQIGLWLDQGISAGLSTNKSLEVEFHERFDEGASNLFEYFVQGGVAFRLRPWATLIPIYRYQRYPGNPTVAYERRLQLNITPLSG